MNLLISFKESSSCRFLSIRKLLKSRICTADNKLHETKKKMLIITYKYGNNIDRNVKNNDDHRKHIKQKAESIAFYYALQMPFWMQNGSQT